MESLIKTTFETQRLIAAAKAVIDDNSGDYETPTRSGCYVIDMDKLRELKLAIEAIDASNLNKSAANTATN